MKFTKIKSIGRTKTKPIYHMVIEKNHNFFGNGLCLHNCDYYGNPKNDGKIMMGIGNTNPFPVMIKKGERIAQGIFSKYLLADGDNFENNGNSRNGGMGSTDE